MDNKLIQIAEDAGKGNHAGTKATKDVSQIAERLGFRRVGIRWASDAETTGGTIVRQLCYLVDWTKAYLSTPENAVVLMQHPYHHKQLIRSRILHRMKKRKHVKFISLVHDVEELRGYRYSDYYRREFDDMLDLADVLIVHNSKMKRWFIGKGLPEERLISLGIFDYLLSGSELNHPRFSRKVNIAGNLSLKRSGYLSELARLDGVDFILFGPNLDDSLCDLPNIQYGGNKSPEEITGCLSEGFGLVWDGESVDSCKGLAGEYLKYNNPHKLSLFIVSGMPLIVWRNSALAEFVEKYHIGIAVDSLENLPDVLSKVDTEEYAAMQAAEEILRQDMIRGQYGQTAIGKALEYLETVQR